MKKNEMRLLQVWTALTAPFLGYHTLAADEFAAFADGNASDFPMKDCNTDSEHRGVPAAGWNFVWENDTLASAGTDEEYTQGIQFGYRYRPDKQPKWLATPMSAVCRWISRVSSPGHDKLLGAGSLFIGQHMFTPVNGQAVRLIDDDRPYAAWLYLGARLEVAQPFEGKLAKSGLFHSFELQVGTLGPRANGEWVQSNFHDLIGSKTLKGWHNQLPNEWGVEALYKVRALAGKWSGKSVQADSTIGAELNVGTIQVLGGLNANFRIGRNLGDPVAEPLAPTFLGARNKAGQMEAIDVPESNDCINGRGVLAIKECYMFIGVTGRVTAFNAFLDGGLFNGGHSVDRDPFTYDWQWGARARWSRFEFNYIAVHRSPEFSPDPVFEGKRHAKHEYGAVNARCFATVGTDTKRWDLVCPGFFALLVGLVAAQ